MKRLTYPSLADFERLCKRPSLPSEHLTDRVQQIILDVKANGDEALLKYTQELDCKQLTSLRVSKEEIEDALPYVSDQLKEAISTAAANIRVFHENQRMNETPVETMPGVICWRQSVAMENIGIYIPGGSAPLFSTILMLAIPAKIAGCKSITLCTPAGSNGKIDPTILYTASYLGIDTIFKIGGAQAIAAMGFGTTSIPKADKILGPGNQYVSKAKELIQPYGVAIDLPAGPSEVLVIADAGADANFVAADLLSQAEHGTDSQVVLLSTSAAVIDRVESALSVQLASLPRADLAQKTLENSFSVVLGSVEECLQYSNAYAPEHLILAVENARQYAHLVQHAGSVFLGYYTCESAGDYASGTNHTLPTNGFARNYSGVSLDSFVKKISFQEISAEGLVNIGPTIEIMAEAEQLIAHKNAVSIRLNQIQK